LSALQAVIKGKKQYPYQKKKKTNPFGKIKCGRWGLSGVIIKFS
jgi:hypothetical protein